MRPITCTTFKQNEIQMSRRLEIMKLFLHIMSKRIEEQKLHILRQHLRSYPEFSGVRVARSLRLQHSFVDHCFYFCPFSCVHCNVYMFFHLRLLMIPLVSFNCSLKQIPANQLVCTAIQRVIFLTKANTYIYICLCFPSFL